MIWTRLKRWLATHPLWCLLVGSSTSFTIVLVPLPHKGEDELDVFTRHYIPGNE